MEFKTLWAFAILLIGGVMLFGAGMPAGYEDASQPYAENETHTIDFSNETSVNPEHKVQSYNESVTVTHNGSVLTAGTDYKWNSTVGDVTWYNTTATTEGGTAYIAYSYDGFAEATEFSANLMTIVIAVVFIMLILVAWTAITGGI